jgi:formylglycine-generating enzyme required for sulfatase activity
MEIIALLSLIAAVVFGIPAFIGVYYAWKQWKLTEKSALPPASSITAGKQLIEGEDLLVEEKYCAHVINTYQFLDFKGIVQVEKIPIRLPLEDVYVKLHAQHLLARSAGREDTRLAGRPVPIAELAEKLNQKMALREEQAGPTSIEDSLKSTSGVVILGDPGAGKSTVLKHLALITAKNRSLSDQSKNKPKLPIIMPVAAYAASLAENADLSIEDYLPEYYRKVRGVSDDLSSLFSSALNEGRVILLLDGLDEVTDVGQRVFVSERIKDFYNWHRTAGNKFVLTSRVVGYYEAPLPGDDLNHFVLLDFGPAEIAQFAEKWTLAFEIANRGDNDEARRSAEDEHGKLLATIHANRSVERLAANPLLLTILALIHRQGTELPRRRVELYELYIKTLISSWARARNLDGRPIGPMDEVEAVKLLAPLAYWMHAEKPSGTAHEQELRRRITDYFVAKKGLTFDDAQHEADHFFDDVRRFAGLLTERGDRMYGFVHLTFEEYLAAREIVLRGQVDRTKSLELFRKHLYEASWHEVILLALGYISILAKEEDVATLMLNGILEDEALDHLGQNVLMAGECLRDVGVEGVGRDCWQNVCIRLAQVIRETKIGIKDRWQAGSLLSVLNDPRFDGYQIVPEMIDIAGGTFWMGSDIQQVGALIDEVRKVTLPTESAWVRDYWIKCLRSESPSHDCAIGPFLISRYPITNSQYKCFLDANPTYAVPHSDEESAQRFNWDAKSRAFPVGRANQPVVLVSWEDCLSYCNWLSATTGRSFGLPTEAEWECAARGTDGRLYPWGNEWEPTKANTIEEGAKDTVAVGLYPDGISPHCLEDCTGQVWEWTSTAWGPDWGNQSFEYPYQDDDREELGSGMWRIVRGGSWDDVAAFARCASRGPNTQSFKSHYIGFRVCAHSDSLTDCSAKSTPLAD